VRRGNLVIPTSSVAEVIGSVSGSQGRRGRGLTVTSGFTGALLGLIAGPGGALAGAAAGGSMGALMGVGSEVVLDDPWLDTFAQALDKDTSALVLVGEKPTIADFGAIVEPLGGKIVKTDLNEADVNAIRKALKFPVRDGAGGEGVAPSAPRRTDGVPPCHNRMI
jgi:uncharacterized membrane protein